MIKQKVAYSALGFLVGWFFGRPLLWFIIGAGSGSLATFLIMKFLKLV
jgi:uncharacterized membrane protein